MVWFGTRQMVWFGYLLGRSLLADIRPSARLFAVVVLELPVLVRHARVTTVTEIFTVAWNSHAIIRVSCTCCFQGKKNSEIIEKSRNRPINF